MNDLQKLFIEAVSSEWLKHKIRDGEDSSCTEGDLDGNIKACIEYMAAMEQQKGEVFSHRAYSDGIRDQISANTDNADLVYDLLQEYCHFQVMISFIRQFPELAARFRMAGLDSWTKLQVDRNTLRPFVQHVVAQLCQTLTSKDVFSLTERVEAAMFVKQITELFEIQISSEAHAMLRWCFEEQELLEEASLQDEENEPCVRTLN